MMRRTTRTLAMVAFTTVVSCTSQLAPVTVTQAEPTVLRIYSTGATTRLVSDLSSTYESLAPHVQLETASGSYATMLDALAREEMPYFISHHLPSEPGYWSIPIAQDGLVVTIHSTNVVTNLTTEQLRQIYQGLVTNWVDVGGENRPILLLSREDGSGTRAELERLVMGQRLVTPTAQIMPSNAAMLSVIASEPDSIGYTTYSNLTDGVTPIRLDNVMPSQQTIAQNSYPLRSTLFVVGLEPPTGEYRQFINWIQGQQGQAVVQRGYVPLPR